MHTAITLPEWNRWLLEAAHEGWDININNGIKGDLLFSIPDLNFFKVWFHQSSSAWLIVNKIPFLCYTCPFIQSLKSFFPAKHSTFSPASLRLHFLKVNFLLIGRSSGGLLRASIHWIASSSCLSAGIAVWGSEVDEFRPHWYFTRTQLYNFIHRFWWNWIFLLIYQTPNGQSASPVA